MNQDQLSPSGSTPASKPHAARSNALLNRDGQGQFAVPAVISNVATELGRNFGISTLYLVSSCLAVLSGAVGNSVRLQCCLWPRPLNAALQWLFVDRTQGRLSQAIDFITRDISALQDERLRDLSNTFRKKLEGQIEWLDQKEAFGGSLEARHDSDNQTKLAELQMRLKPLRFIQDPPFGQLTEAVARTGDHALLALYSQPGFHRVHDAAKGKWAADLLSLERGWIGQSLITVGHKESDDLRILEPAVSSLILCGEDDLSQLFGTEPLSHSILGRMIPMTVAESARSGRTADFCLESLQAWRHLIERADQLRELGARDLLQLDGGAEELLMQYWSESQGGSLQPEGRFLAKVGPMLAAKVSIGYQLALAPRGMYVSVPAMESAIQLTRALLNQGSNLMSVFPKFSL
jgi:hypothetical protein